MLHDFTDPVLQLKGRTVLYIENYRKLLCYTKTEIRILTKSGVLEVTGTDFVIRYYSKEDLEIKGMIKRICFLE